jgi:glycerate 2-kinase
MAVTPRDLRSDALHIWHAGLDAVRSERLMHHAVRVEGHTLILGNDFLGLPEDALRIDLNTVKRIAVVGAGKAGAGMAAALEEILGPAIIEEKQLTGWVNVPADCVRKLQRIHLHAARPPGINEPTEAGVAGAQEILRIVESLGSDDLCIALISGGGSALLPAPIEGISLADKLAVTKFLSAAGANIAELNTVRKQLSRIKGGGLARARRAGRLVSLIISDIPGDPLDLIASGPTVPDDSTPQAALAVLERFGAREAGVPASVFTALEKQQTENVARSQPLLATKNFVIGNNDMAVTAAKVEAEQLGYHVYANCAAQPEGAVEEIGRHLADINRQLTDPKLLKYMLEINCWIYGGEGTVKLAPQGERGLGGRNQQTVLAALVELTKQTKNEKQPKQIVILSGGTDGEDGPTDAAGAFVDRAVIEEARRRGLNAEDYLRRNDAYHFFEQLGALIKTGPTNTNVCDLRIVVTSQ